MRRLPFFDARIDKSAGPDACWPWLGPRNHKGYGLHGRQKAHRVAQTLSAGPIPKGLHVLHWCDHPWCVNPKHLRAGTNAENIAERDLKGRHARLGGEEHGQATLAASEVRAMRAVWREYGRTSGSWPRSALSKEHLGDLFEVSGVQVSNIIHRRLWKYT